MADTQPGEPAGRRPASAPAPARGNRRLAEAPGARFAGREDGAARTGADRSALAGPLIRASVCAAIGAAVLVLVGAVLASTAGLLFAAGATGGATGLVLARAAVPEGGARPITRRAVTWLAVAVVLIAIAGADLATWVVARGEGGTLGPLDFLLDTFGLFVPGELLLGALGAAWGARSRPGAVVTREPPAGPEEIAFRRPTEADYGAMVRVIDDWWGGRKLDHLLPRLWLQHFTGTSWLAETAEGRLVGFLVGFHSPDHANVAYCDLIATNPSLRGRGIGRALYERFFADALAVGRHEVRAITWPGNRTSLAFHRALGFEIQAGPGSQNLYGTPAQADYDFEREDRTILVRII